MSKKRNKIALEQNMSSIRTEDEEIFFWASKTVEERLIEAERLRRIFWTAKLGKYPDKMEKVGRVINISQKE